MLVTKQEQKIKGWCDETRIKRDKIFRRKAPELAASKPPGKYSSIDFDDAEDQHLLLARKCIHYLLRDDFSRDLFDLDRSENCQLIVDDPWGSLFIQDEVSFSVKVCNSLATRDNFFDYAASNWARHFAACNKIAPLQLTLAAIAISNGNSPRFMNWFRYYWIVMGTKQALPSFDPFLVACYFGHASSLFLMCNQGLISQESIMSGLFWAAKTGKLDIVQILVRTNVPINRSILGCQNALVTSAECGHFEIVKLFLELDIFDVNSPGRRGRTSLSMASGCGHTRIVDFLLRYECILPDQPDDAKCTPLIWAISNNRIDVVRRLLADRRVNANQIDKTGKSALMWAATDGLIEIVKLLLGQENLEVEKHDRRGRSALFWAAMNGQLAALRLLIKHNNVSERDQYGRNAISWSCAGGHYEVLECLLEYDKAGADQEDEDGWTPLMWAVDSASLKVVKTLLLTGMVDIGHKNKKGQNAVMWAEIKGTNMILDYLNNAA